MKRLGIFGGTFSPPHLGHLKSALAFYDRCALDELLVIPTYLSPHKQMKGDATPEMRFEMLELLFEKEQIGTRNIHVSDFEWKQGGKSYTYLTLEHFANEKTQLFLLMGSDMFLTLEEWKNPTEILALSTVVCNRRDSEEEALKQQKKHLEETYGAKILLPEFEPFPLSSTDLRALLKESESAPEMLSSKVEEYIVKHQLYSVNQELYVIKKALRQRLSKKRVSHVLSVEKEVRSLSELFHLTSEETLILQKAALLHDITHEWSKKEQLCYLQKKNFPLKKEDLDSPSILHEYSGALLSMEEFSLEKEGADAIFCHTTGKEDMSLLDKLLCLADYIEETRPYDSCKKLRADFYQALKTHDKLRTLDEALLRYFEETQEHLKSKHLSVHPDSEKAAKFLKERLVKREIL